MSRWGGRIEGAVKEIELTDGKRVLFETISSPEQMPVPFDGEPYVGVIWASDVSFDDQSRYRLAQELVKSNCRYAVCGGVDCERWHDDVDLAWVDLDLQSDSADPLPLVMTT